MPAAGWLHWTQRGRAWRAGAVVAAAALLLCVVALQLMRENSMVLAGKSYWKYQSRPLSEEEIYNARSDLLAVLGSTQWRSTGPFQGSCAPHPPPHPARPQLAFCTLAALHPHRFAPAPRRRRDRNLLLPPPCPPSGHAPARPPARGMRAPSPRLARAHAIVGGLRPPCGGGRERHLRGHGPRLQPVPPLAPARLRGQGAARVAPAPSARSLAHRLAAHRLPNPPLRRQGAGSGVLRLPPLHLGGRRRCHAC